ncbi:MAG: Ig-like domain-containing protein [Acetobacteraceae bacterium]|nr:Ig-like domain-containing protein [Acetobacteraceae bacterium]
MTGRWFSMAGVAKYDAVRPAPDAWWGRCAGVAWRRAAGGTVAGALTCCYLALFGLALLGGVGCAPPAAAPGEQEGSFVALVCPLPGETDVPADASVTIRFSAPMDRRSVEAAMKLDPAVKYVAEWVDDTTVVLKPQGRWPAGRAISLEVGRTAVSRAGEPLGKPYAWSFTIRPDFLRAVSLRPEDGEAGVALDTPLEITFDRPLDAASALGALDISPTTPGSVSCQEAVLRFVPSGGWLPSTTYSVFVRSGPSRGLRGSDGKGLEAPLHFSFTTVTRIGLWEAYLDGREPRRVATLASGAVAAVASPDGRRLALVVEEELPDVEAWGFFGSLWLMDADGSRLRQVAEGSLWTEANDLNNLWSPDGRYLAFSDIWHPERPAGLWVVPAEGGSPRLVVASGADEVIKTANPAWSPDGQRIAFTSHRDGNYEIYLMNADGTGLRNLTRHPATDNSATWSPDGKKIAFVSSRDGGYDVYVLEP